MFERPVTERMQLTVPVEYASKLRASAVERFRTPSQEAVRLWEVAWREEARGNGDPSPVVRNAGMGENPNHGGPNA